MSVDSIIICAVTLVLATCAFQFFANYKPADTSIEDEEEQEQNFPTTYL